MHSFHSVEGIKKSKCTRLTSQCNIHTNEIIAGRRKVPSLSFAKQRNYRKGHFLVSVICKLDNNFRTPL